MHITLDRNVNSNSIAPIEFEVVHTRSFIAIDVQGAGGVVSSVVITQDGNGNLEAQIYAGDPQNVIPHRQTLHATPDQVKCSNQTALVMAGNP